MRGFDPRIYAAFGLHETQLDCRVESSAMTRRYFLTQITRSTDCSTAVAPVAAVAGEM
jgi:hypothetical protein